jgi:hypothetical protein
LSNWNKNNNAQEMPNPFNPDYPDKYIAPPIAIPWVDKIHMRDMWKKYLCIDIHFDIMRSLFFESIVL